MKLKMVLWWAGHETVCYCGYSFGWCPDGWCPKENTSLWEAKRKHFAERHPRRWAQGGIA